uniref:Sec23_trunk domain-containing protein n=1 Tax=Macrostomum lignano TaxID=282301 RepID=A0A1I8F656_9PLAT
SSTDTPFKKAIASHEAFLRSLPSIRACGTTRRFRNFLMDESEGGSSHSGGTKQRVQSLLQPGLLLTALIDSRRQPFVPRILGSVAGASPMLMATTQFFNAQRRFAIGYQRALLPALRCLDRLALLQKSFCVTSATTSSSTVELRRSCAAEMDAGLADSLHRLAADCSAVVALCGPSRATGCQFRGRQRPPAPRPATLGGGRRRQSPAGRLPPPQRSHRRRQAGAAGLPKRWLLALCGRLRGYGRDANPPCQSQVQLLEETIDKLRND